MVNSEGVKKSSSLTTDASYSVESQKTSQIQGVPIQQTDSTVSPPGLTSLDAKYYTKNNPQEMIQPRSITTTEKLSTTVAVKKIQEIKMIRKAFFGEIYKKRSSKNLTEDKAKICVKRFLSLENITNKEKVNCLITLLESDKNIKNNQTYLDNTLSSKAQICILSEITSLLKSADFSFNKETKQIIERVQNLYSKNLQSRSLLWRTNNNDKPLEQAIKDSLFRLELENNLLDKTLTKDVPKEKRDWTNETGENETILDKFFGAKKSILPTMPMSLADFKLSLLGNYCHSQLDNHPQAGTIEDLRNYLVEDIKNHIINENFPFEKKENYFLELKNKIGHLRSSPKKYVKEIDNEIERLSVHSARGRLPDSLDYKKYFFGGIYNKNSSVNISLEKTKELTKKFIEDYVPKNKLTIQEASEWLLTILENDSNKNNDNYLGKNSFDNKAQIGILSEITSLLKSSDFAFNKETKQIIDRVQNLYNNNLQSRSLLGRTNNDDKPLEQAIKDSLFRLELENNLLDKTLTKDLPKEKRDWNNETEENWLIIDKFLGEKKTSLPRKPISLADFKLRLLENYCQPQMDKNPQAGTIKDLRILLIEDILKHIKDDDFPFEKKENYFRVLKNKIGNLRTLPKEWVKKADNEIKRLSVHSERRKLLDSLNYKKSFFGDIYNKNLSVNISLEKTKELTKQFLEEYVPKNKLTIQEASEWLLTLLENDSNKNNDNYSKINCI